jgi:hypothetical protein
MVDINLSPVGAIGFLICKMHEGNAERIVFWVI